MADIAIPNDYLKVPYYRPETVEEHAANLRALLRWANRYPTSWVDFSPGQFDQGASTNIAHDVYNCEFHWISFDTIEVNFSVHFTAAGTANNAIYFYLPVLSTRNISGFHVIGSGYFYDASLPGTYPLLVRRAGGTLNKVQFLRSDQATAADLGVDPNFAIASGDDMTACFTYRV